MGNADAHAKNLSLLITQEGIALAPFYDLVSTAVYDDLTTKMALKIGGENRPEWIQRRHWQSLAETSAANPRIVWQRVAELAEGMPLKAEETAAKLELQKEEMGTIDKLLALIAARAKHVLGQM
jgi:serine/threonine-protein kinase HipA